MNDLTSRQVLWCCILESTAVMRVVYWWAHASKTLIRSDNI